MSAGSFLEAAIVVDGRHDPILSRQLDELIATLKIAIEPVTYEQASIGRAAYRDFGRGSGHPARLNYGDCFAYALAKATGEPLLYVGNDFGHTDLRSATSEAP
jgi:ribonuclease VapC